MDKYMLAYEADDYELALAEVGRATKELEDAEEFLNAINTNPKSVLNPARNCIACQRCSGTQICNSTAPKCATARLNKARMALDAAQERLHKSYVAGILLGECTTKSNTLEL